MLEVKLFKDSYFYVIMNIAFYQEDTYPVHVASMRKIRKS
jgi:hypothetical protein